MKKLVLGLFCLCLMVPFVYAENMSPLGKWKTLSDKEGEEGEAKSIIEITKKNGKLYGTIIELFHDSDQDPNPLCTECRGDKKDKPIKGMTIMYDLVKKGDWWAGGYILDPDNGKVYKCKIKVNPGGKELTVRGFIGFSLIGRFQTWIRIQE